MVSTFLCLLPWMLVILAAKRPEGEERTSTTSSKDLPSQPDLPAHLNNDCPTGFEPHGFYCNDRHIGRQSPGFYMLCRQWDPKRGYYRFNHAIHRVYYYCSVDRFCQVKPDTASIPRSMRAQWRMDSDWSAPSINCLARTQAPYRQPWNTGLSKEQQAEFRKALHADRAARAEQIEIARQVKKDVRVRQGKIAKPVVRLEAGLVQASRKRPRSQQRLKGPASRVEPSADGASTSASTISTEEVPVDGDQVHMLTRTSSDNSIDVDSATQPNQAEPGSPIHLDVVDFDWEDIWRSVDNAELRDHPQVAMLPTAAAVEHIHPMAASPDSLVSTSSASTGTGTAIETASDVTHPDAGADAQTDWSWLDAWFNDDNSGDSFAHGDIFTSPP